MCFFGVLTKRLRVTCDVNAQNYPFLNVQRLIGQIIIFDGHQLIDQSDP